jgi:hypothetical protein
LPCGFLFAVCMCTAKVLKNFSFLLFPFNPCTYNSQNRHIFPDTYMRVDLVFTWVGEHPCITVGYYLSPLDSSANSR